MELSKKQGNYTQNYHRNCCGGASYNWNHGGPVTISLTENARKGAGLRLLNPSRR